MYKIPKEIDVSTLKNEVVSQISFTLDHIFLSLNNSAIQFSGPFIFKFNGIEWKQEDVFPVNSDFGLLNLLGKKVQEIFCNNERTDLNIEFEDNLFLKLESNNSYECFELNIDGKRIIV
jgi:hypothetical protein